MSKRNEKKDRRKLEVKKETLRKMDLTADQLGQVAGGIYGNDNEGGTGNRPSKYYC